MLILSSNTIIARNALRSENGAGGHYRDYQTMMIRNLTDLLRAW
jgi:hypothetical protein